MGYGERRNGNLYVYLKEKDYHGRDQFHRRVLEVDDKNNAPHFGVFENDRDAEHTTAALNAFKPDGAKDEDREGGDS